MKFFAKLFLTVMLICAVCLNITKDIGWFGNLFFAGVLYIDIVITDSKNKKE